MSQRSWTLAGVGVGVLLAGLTYVAGVGPELSHTSSVNSQTSGAKQSNSVLSAQIESLRAQSKNLDALTTKLSADQIAVPPNDDMAAFIREVHTLAVGDGLAVKSITVSPPALAGANAAGATPVAGQAAGQLFQIPISIVVTGIARHEVAFIGSLHALGSRAALINSVQTTWTSDTASYVADMTVSLDVFVAPQTAAQEATLQKELKSS